jgi:hypothetical protein
MSYLQNTKFFTEMHGSYRSICANYVNFQNFVISADLEVGVFIKSLIKSHPKVLW